jgi:hypothetical protein
VWSTELINKITTSSIITVALYAKVITQAVTTRTTTIINTESMMFRVSNIIIIIIIIITITNGYCFIGLASCTLRDRRGTASIQGDFRGLLLPLPNDQWRS